MACGLLPAWEAMARCPARIVRRGHGQGRGERRQAGGKTAERDTAAGAILQADLDQRRPGGHAGDPCKRAGGALALALVDALQLAINRCPSKERRLDGVRSGGDACVAIRGFRLGQVSPPRCACRAPPQGAEEGSARQQLSSCPSPGSREWLHLVALQ